MTLEQLLTRYRKHRSINTNPAEQDTLKLFFNPFVILLTGESIQEQPQEPWPGMGDNSENSLV